jgi:hypothetical protein
MILTGAVPLNWHARLRTPPQRGAEPTPNSDPTNTVDFKAYLEQGPSNGEIMRTNLNWSDCVACGQAHWAQWYWFISYSFEFFHCYKKIPHHTSSSKTAINSHLANSFGCIR